MLPASWPPPTWPRRQSCGWNCFPRSHGRGKMGQWKMTLVSKGGHCLLPWLFIVHVHVRCLFARVSWLCVISLLVLLLWDALLQPGHHPFWLPRCSCISQQSPRQEDDVSSVLKGVSTASLEALNYVDYLNNKYAPCSAEIGVFQYSSQILIRSDGCTKGQSVTGLKHTYFFWYVLFMLVGIREHVGKTRYTSPDKYHNLTAIDDAWR